MINIDVHSDNNTRNKRFIVYNVILIMLSLLLLISLSRFYYYILFYFPIVLAFKRYFQVSHNFSDYFFFLRNLKTSVITLYNINITLFTCSLRSPSLRTALCLIALNILYRNNISIRARYIIMSIPLHVILCIITYYSKYIFIVAI